MTNQPKKRGRPAGSTQSEHMQPVNLTLYPEQVAKLKQLGGSAWVRDQIDKAKQNSSSV